MVILITYHFPTTDCYIGKNLAGLRKDLLFQTHRKACWSRLYVWKIEDLLSKVLWSYNNLLQHSILLFSFGVTWSSIGVCYIHRIWLVILLIPWRVRGHSRCSLLFPGAYSHTWVFSSVRAVLSVTFIPDFVMIKVFISCNYCIAHIVDKDEKIGMLIHLHQWLPFGCYRSLLHIG